MDPTTVTIIGFVIGFFLGWNKKKIVPWVKQLQANYKKNQAKKQEKNGSSLPLSSAKKEEQEKGNQ